MKKALDMRSSLALLVVLIFSGTSVLAPPVLAEDPAALKARLQAALAAKGPDYEPRTRHLLAGGAPKYLNRLILEASPYLVQHAHNPVDWRPWGAEALAEARRRDVPLFVSVGYSTCYWCHVLERESFEDEAIASDLNKNFVPVKVDRERRPDLDETLSGYMQVTRGSVGHPINAILTPDGDPFFVFGYAPPNVFAEQTNVIAAAWTDKRQEVLEEARMLGSFVRLLLLGDGAPKAGTDIDPEMAAGVLMDLQDDFNGGFGDGVARFPRAAVLDFLTDHYGRTGYDGARETLLLALEAIARGAITDHVGGGFHRYTVDPDWSQPHFEKMLYNQATLASVLVRAGRLLNDPRLVETGLMAADYVLREMTSADGYFYSAQDSETGGDEGASYLWDPESLQAALGPESDRAAALFGVEEHGPFEGETALVLSDDAWAGFADLQTVREKLFAARSDRVAAAKDTKVIVAWNGLMIAGLAEISAWTGKEQYRAAAARAGEAIWSGMREEDGLLWRVRHDGVLATPGQLEDYAHLALAFLALSDVGDAGKWQGRAAALIDTVLADFADPAGGAYFAVPPAETLAALQVKPTTDEPYMSANTALARTLVRLAARTGDPRYARAADSLLDALSNRASKDPLFHAATLATITERDHGSIGPTATVAGGVVQADIAASGQGHRITLQIAPGWHVNAHQPLQDYLVATALVSTGDGARADVKWPEPEIRSLAFAGEDLALYEGKVVLPVTGAKPGQPLRLTVQACSDSICLPEETMTLVPL